MKVIKAIGSVCANCRFWDQHRFGKYPAHCHGTCTRHPPFAMVMNFQSGAIDHIQPITVGCRRCGEFKRRK